MRAYAVIDIGGTAIKYGCATEEGQFLEKASRPTRAGAVSIPDVVLAIVKDMAARHELAGIAIDTAGIVRPGEDGEIVFAGETTFPGYSGTKLGRIVRETMQLPVLVENDVNAAALGEVWRGAARGASSAFSSLLDSVSSTLCSRLNSLHCRSLICIACCNIKVVCVHSVVVLSVCYC